MFSFSFPTGAVRCGSNRSVVGAVVGAVPIVAVDGSFVGAVVGVVTICAVDGSFVAAVVGTLAGRLQSELLLFSLSFPTGAVRCGSNWSVVGAFLGAVVVAVPIGAVVGSFVGAVDGVVVDAFVPTGLVQLLLVVRAPCTNIR